MLITINPGLVIWTVITFVLLVFILKKFAWGPILTALDRREKSIQDNVVQAQKSREEAEKLLSDYQQKLDSARDDVRKIIEEGRQKGERAREELLEQARREYDEQLARAKKEIELARKKAVDDVRKYVVDLTLDMASKVTGKMLTDEDHRKLALDTLAEADKLK